jgi:hypothetical protein
VISLRKSLKTALVLYQPLALAGCGGGSSGGSADEPKPTHQADPPSVVIESTEDTFLSGSTFLVLVSGEADGLATTPFSISCTNGVDTSIDVHRVTLRFPHVSVLTQSDCTATVTDSTGRSASQTLTISILPETDIGQVVGIFDPPLKLVLPNFNTPPAIESYGTHVVAIADSTRLSGGHQIKAIEGTNVIPRKYHRDDIIMVEGDYQSIDFVQSPSLAAHGLSTGSMSIASVLENRIYWLSEEWPSSALSIRKIIDVNSPCFVAQTNTLGANDMIVGQVDQGLSVFNIETGADDVNIEYFNATLIQNVGVGRSLCHMLRGIVPAGIFAQYPGYPEPYFDPYYAAPLTAIDYKTNELVYYGDINGDNFLDEMGAMPIETNSTDKLDIVQVLSRGGPTQFPIYFLVLLSNGKHIGEHRLVQIGFDSDVDEFKQEMLYEWSEGVPVSMLQGPLGGSLAGGIFGPDLVVVLGTTEQSLFFENVHPMEKLFDEPPIYDEPTLFDVGTGAGSAVTAESPFDSSPDRADEGVLVSYPETGTVVYISLPVTQ